MFGLNVVEKQEERVSKGNPDQHRGALHTAFSISWTQKFSDSLKHKAVQSLTKGIDIEVSIISEVPTYYKIIKYVIFQLFEGSLLSPMSTI